MGSAPFEAGWKFHLYLDHEWTRLIEGSFFYKKYANDFAAGGAEKLIEDELDLKKIKNKEQIIRAIKSFEPIEILRIPPGVIKKYYLAVADYLEDKDYLPFVNLIFDTNFVEKMSATMEKMRGDGVFISFLDGLFDKIKI